jgi:hypothetical protein
MSSKNWSPEADEGQADNAPPLSRVRGCCRVAIFVGDPNEEQDRLRSLCSRFSANA